MGSMGRAIVLATAIGTLACGSNSGSSVEGGTATLSISNAAGSNVAPNIPPITMVVGYAGLEVGALSYEHQAGVNVKRWQLVVDLGATPMTGQSFTLAPSPTAAGAAPMASMHIEEAPASGAFREWNAVSGSIAVLSRVGDRVTLTFKGVPFEPTQGASANQATGMFSLSGQLTVDDISQPLPN